MHPAKNFLGAYTDLGRCADSWDDYELMRIPGLLRLLLIDRLVDQANRELRVKYKFAVGSYVRHADDPSLVFESVADGFDPAVTASIMAQAGREWRPTEFKRDAFLALVVMIVAGQPVTVRQLIENLAYVHGLVHPFEPKAEREAEILEWRRTLEVGGQSTGLREIRSIGRVVHQSLAGVARAVAAKYAPDA